MAQLRFWHFRGWCVAQEQFSFVVLTVKCTVLVAYDWMLSLADEIRHIWFKQNTASYLYMATRYVGVIAYGPVAVSISANGLNPSVRLRCMLPLASPTELLLKAMRYSHGHSPVRVYDHSSFSRWCAFPSRALRPAVSSQAA